jgi:hypothetical protein
MRREPPLRCRQQETTLLDPAQLTVLATAPTGDPRSTYCVLALAKLAPPSTLPVTAVTPLVFVPLAAPAILRLSVVPLPRW